MVLGMRCRRLMSFSKDLTLKHSVYTASIFLTTFRILGDRKCNASDLTVRVAARDFSFQNADWLSIGASRFSFRPQPSFVPPLLSQTQLSLCVSRAAR